ncbi:MAG: hypothetical protein WB509_32350 [Acetobacteraceae bacterium]
MPRIIRRSHQSPRGMAGAGTKHLAAVELDPRARARHAQTSLRRVSDPQGKQMPHPKIVRCPRYLPPGTVTSDQVSGIDVRLYDTSHGKIAGAHLHQEGGKTIGKSAIAGVMRMVLNRQGHIQRAGLSQRDDLFVRKCCGSVQLRGALLHPRHQCAHFANDRHWQRTS